VLSFKATDKPQAVSFKTMPHPGFPTDLQAPMMAALCLAEGTSVIHETVFENRMLHVHELQKMGAQIELVGGTATVTGVAKLMGADVIATDIRASAALIIAGLAAQGTTTMSCVQHVYRGYNKLDEKLNSLGADVRLISKDLVFTKKSEMLSLEIK
jgi:UDP-N-acetylglucosamine 1-carboxyvinyltransferase